ncbi:hypothetical protein LTR62_002695 [Meristemomyces frigidus]|uniref:Uncharacterized protein n=1 Tax=Meristemomyces frigidus TaxID=1508187 RepID=A0AAN7TLI4_9PEZI|nr:hypothetical protein LTR62_002695 [Meristemomyces frigidus]
MNPKANTTNPMTAYEEAVALCKASDVELEVDDELEEVVLSDELEESLELWGVALEVLGEVEPASDVAVEPAPDADATEDGEVETASDVVVEPAPPDAEATEDGESLLTDDDCPLDGVKFVTVPSGAWYMPLL